MAKLGAAQDQEYSLTNWGTIRLSQFIGLPTDEVWRALVTPELLAQWWAAGEIWATAFLGTDSYRERAG